MDINSPSNPLQQPNNSGGISPTPRPFGAPAPTPPPMRNPMTAPAPVVPQPMSVPSAAPAQQPVSQPAPQPVVQTPTPLAMPEPMVQMSAPVVPASAPAPILTPVVPAPAPAASVPTPVAPATPQSIPVVPPMRVSEPAAGEVFSAPNTTPYVVPPLTPLSSIRSVPPAGGAVAVAPVARKSHWFRTLAILILLILGAGAAYVFGYDKTVLLSSKDLLAQSLVSNTEVPQGSGEMEMKVTVTSEIASDPMPVGEAIYASPTVGKTEPITFDFSMNADFGFTNTDGVVESFVKFDPLAISIKPESLAQEQGIPSTIDAAFEVRVVDGVAYAQISRLTLEIAGMIELMTGVDVVGQWISTTSYEATTTTNIENMEDAQRIGLRVLDEAVTVESDVYKIGSREITFTIDPEKVVSVMADEQGIDEEMKKEAIEDLKNVEFKKPIRFVVVIDRTGQITEASFSTSITESQTKTVFDAMFSYRITDTGKVTIEAPSNAINLDELIATTMQSSMGGDEYADQVFMADFYNVIAFADLELQNQGTYKNACKNVLKQFQNSASSTNANFASSASGYEIKDAVCFDADKKLAVSAALYKDGQVISRYCYDAATNDLETTFMPVADAASVSSISTIR